MPIHPHLVAAIPRMMKNFGLIEEANALPTDEQLGITGDEPISDKEAAEALQ